MVSFTLIGLASWLRRVLFMVDLRQPFGDYADGDDCPIEIAAMAARHYIIRAES
jgi:hypothetical protein